MPPVPSRGQPSNSIYDDARLTHRVFVCFGLLYRNPDFVSYTEYDTRRGRRVETRSNGMDHVTA